MTITLSKVLPDPYDGRDYLFPIDWNAVLPDAVDLRESCSAIENQLAIGSCTANAVVGACEMFGSMPELVPLSGATPIDELSRLFNYFTSRDLLTQESGHDWLAGDQGSALRWALHSANKFGIAREVVWPYGDGATSANIKPSDAAYADAAQYRLGAYYRIPAYSGGPDLADRTYYTMAQIVFAIKYALARGYPVAISMAVGRKLYTIRPDEIYGPINPALGNDQIGGHAMGVVGYYTNEYGSTIFIVRNSWGVDWCDKGYFLMSEQGIFYNNYDYWVPMNFAGISTVGPDLTGTPPMAQTLTLEQVRQAYSDVLGIVLTDDQMALPGPRYWQQTPGATVRDLYYGVKVQAETLLAATP